MRYAVSYALGMQNPIGDFLSTTAGKVTAAVLAVGAVGAAVAYAKNASASGTSANASASGTSANFLFSLATPYKNTTGGTNTTPQVVSDLTAAGFTNILAQSDPTNPSGQAWLVAATYAPSGAYAAQLAAADVVHEAVPEALPLHVEPPEEARRAAWAQR